jgi:DNA-binding response OmpR family regulator
MIRKHIKVLLIEDNEGDVRLIWEILSEVRNSPFYLEVAGTLLSGLQTIEKNTPDVILLDLSLPDSNGIYTLNRVRDKAKKVPVVVLTGFDDEITAIKSLKEGAQDYLVKGRTDSDLLKRALIYSIERNSLLNELEGNENMLKESYEKLKELDGQREKFIDKVSTELKPIVEDLKVLFDEYGLEKTDAQGYREKLMNIIQRISTFI